MFDSLDDTIKHDTQAQTTKGERWLKWLAGTVIAVVVFGGLYFGIRMLE